MNHQSMRVLKYSNGLQINQHIIDIHRYVESLQNLVSTKILAVFGVVTNIM